MTLACLMGMFLAACVEMTNPPLTKCCQKKPHRLLLAWQKERTFFLIMPVIILLAQTPLKSNIQTANFVVWTVAWTYAKASTASCG